MTSRNMVWLVARKEIKTMFRNKGLLSAGFYVSGMFGVLNTLLSGPVFTVNNARVSFSF